MSEIGPSSYRSSPRGSPLRRAACAASLALCLPHPVRAQQLQPRAYEPAPVGLNLGGASYTNSGGSVGLDPSLPVTSVRASVNTATAYYARTFGVRGRQAQFTAYAPYVWGRVEGDVNGEHQIARRSGPGDPYLRFSINILGGPALDREAFLARKPASVLGASMLVQAPLGQYDSSKLINIGMHRWAFKPELGFSQPIRDWRLEAYVGGWFYTDNNDYFGGHLRRQAPLLEIQAHAVRDFARFAWGALDFTYFAGGRTTVSGRVNADRQDNTRTGVTIAFPVWRSQLLKLTYARGVTTRVGSDLNTFGVSWQAVWF